MELLLRSSIRYVCVAIALEWIYNSYKIVHIATYTVHPNVLFPVAYASAYIHWYI